MNKQEKKKTFMSKKRARANSADELEAECERLRRNDPTLEWLPGPYGIGVGHGQALGEALLCNGGNTHVTKATVDFGRVLPYMDYKTGYMSTTAVAEFIAPLVQFVKTSPVLRLFTVDSFHEDFKINELLAKLFFDAAFQNKGIDHLIVGLDRFPTDAFVPKRPCPALKSLGFEFHRSLLFDSVECRTIRDSFRWFPALTKVTVGTSDERLAESILKGIRDQACCQTLQEIEVRFERGGDVTRAFWSALKAIVQSDARTRPFQNLSLAGIRFNATSMAGLIRVLKRRPCHSDSMISMAVLSELSLQRCRFDRDARRLLVAFMQTRIALQPNGLPVVDNGPTTMASTSPPLLERFHLDLDDFDDEYRCRDLSTATLVSMISLRTEGNSDEIAKSNYFPTVGSQIESLSLHPLRKCFPGFLQHLACCADAIRLKELIVPIIEEERDVLAFARCIDRIPSLVAVSTSIYGSYISAEPILVSLKRNGNIGKARVNESCRSSEFTAKLAQAFVERNQFLDPLLLEATAKTSSESLSSLVVDSTTLTCPNDQRDKKSLSLSLLQTAQQIPHTTSSSVLRSLLRLDDSIGDEPINVWHG